MSASNLPLAAVNPTVDPQVTARVDHEVGETALAQDAGDAIDCVALGDAAGPDRHALATQ